MANYEDNRIVCSAETAAQLISSCEDGFFEPIDFGKALVGRYHPKYSHQVAYSEGAEIDNRADGMVDIGFCTRSYPAIDTVIAFITKYPDAEWWLQIEYSVIYHYYWCDGEVVEDVYYPTDEEEEYLSSLFNCGDIRQYSMIFTEKLDQSKYINYHPDKESEEYKEYEKLVEKIADEIIEENELYFLKKYDYHWGRNERYYSASGSISWWCAKNLDLDKNKYKMNTMSRDILDVIQSKLYPYDYTLYNAIFGLAIGDALGVPFEFHDRDAFEYEKDEMAGYGTWGQPPGTWSDDTSMTLATLKSLKDNDRKVVIEDIKNNFLKWYNDAEFTAHDEVFDIGRTTRIALTTGIPGLGERENGNGSLMRILPLAFINCTDNEIRRVSAITHAHEISTEACVIYVHIARRLLAGEDISEIIPTLVYDKPFDRLKAIDKLQRNSIKSSGYVVDTLEAALWALSYKRHLDTGFNDVVSKAIKLGGDTDTIAAVAGGLAGIMYGLGYYGNQHLETLKGKDKILECLW